MFGLDHPLPSGAVHNILHFEALKIDMHFHRCTKMVLEPFEHSLKLIRANVKILGVKMAVPTT